MGRILRILLIVAAVFVGLRILRRLALQGRGPARPRGPGRPRRSSPYEILEIPEGANQDEIRAAWQRLSMEYHPDRVAHMGRDLRDLAEKRIKAINEAYEQLRRQA